MCLNTTTIDVTMLHLYVDDYNDASHRWINRHKDNTVVYVGARVRYNSLVIPPHYFRWRMAMGYSAVYTLSFQFSHRKVKR